GQVREDEHHAAFLWSAMKKISLLSLRVLLGRRISTREKRARSSPRNFSNSSLWKSLQTKWPRGRRNRSAAPSASSQSSSERVWSVTRTPVVFGAMSESTTSNGGEMP